MSLSLLLACLAVAADAPKVDRPNVVLLVADDLRVELGCYGAKGSTPNIDRLARRGVRFTRAYCQQALCNPSRSSFLTGLRPDTLRLWCNGTHFREGNPDVVTLPQWFKQQGYVTRNVGKIFHNWHTKEKGDRRSWSADEFIHYASHGDDRPLVKGTLPINRALPFGRDYGSVPMCERREVPDSAYYDGRVADEAVRVLGEIKDKPFFLAVGFWKPHAPFNAPKSYWERYDAGKLPRWQPARPRGSPEIAWHDSREILGIPPKQIVPSTEQAAEMRHGYFANLSYMDTQVGKVLASLEKHGLERSTVVVFLSDHGYHLGEHGLWGKTSCFELDARVPLLLAGPGVTAAGKASDALVELVDLFPTLTKLCRLPAPKRLEGTSLVTLLGKPAGAGKTFALTQHPRPAYYDRTPAGVPEAMGYSVRTDRVRYTEWRAWKTGKVLARELYDHQRDSAELHNRIDDPTDPAALRQAVEQMHRIVPARWPPDKR